MQLFLQNNKRPLLIAIYIFFISFFTERLYFNHDLLNKTNVAYVILKLFLFIIITLSVFAFAFVMQKIREQNEYYIFAAKVFISYFILMFTILLFIWPGLWRDDEFHIISGCKNFHMNSYQHYMTSCFYIMCLMVIPCAAGILIIQQIIYSLIVAYIAFNLNKYIFPQKISIICLLPFVFIPVLDSNLYPMRCSMYAFIEVLFVSIIFFQLKKSKKCNLIFDFLYIICAIILSVWRSEAFYYIICAPLIYDILLRKCNTAKEKIMIPIIIVLLSFLGIQIQNNISQKQIGDNTFIISTLGFIYEEQNNDNLYENVDIEKDIDQVINLDILKEHGRGSIWSDLPLVRKGYTRTQYKEYQMAYVKLVLNNIRGFFKYSLNNYLLTNSIGNTSIFLGNTEHIYDNESDGVIGEFKSYYLNNPMFKTLRKNIIAYAELREYTGSVSAIVRFIRYNSIVPLIILILLTLGFMIKHKWSLFIVNIVVLIKFPLIFATAPSLLFMYYYSIYLIGYLEGIFFLTNRVYGRLIIKPKLHLS